MKNEKEREKSKDLEKDCLKLMLEYYNIMKELIISFIPDAELDSKTVNKGFIFQKINHYLNKILSNLKIKVQKLKNSDRKQIYSDILEIIHKFKDIAKTFQIPLKKEIQTLQTDMIFVKSLLHKDFQIDEGIDIDFSKSVVDHYFNLAYSKINPPPEIKIPPLESIKKTNTGIPTKVNLNRPETSSNNFCILGNNNINNNNNLTNNVTPNIVASNYLNNIINNLNNNINNNLNIESKELSSIEGNSQRNDANDVNDANDANDTNDAHNFNADYYSYKNSTPLCLENNEVLLTKDLMIDSTQNSTADESALKNTKDFQRFINYQLELNKEQKQINEMLMLTINNQGLKIKELENKIESLLLDKKKSSLD